MHSFLIRGTRVLISLIIVATPFFAASLGHFFLVLMAGFAFLLFLSGSALEKKLFFPRVSAFAAASILMLVALAATLFGDAPYESVFGPSDPAASFAVSLALFLLFWLVVWQTYVTRDSVRVLFLIVLGGFAAAVAAALAWAGVPISWRAAGGVRTIALLAAVLSHTALFLCVYTGEMRLRFRGSWVLRILLVVFSIAAAGVVVVIGDRVAHFFLLALMCAHTVYGILRAREFHTKWLVVPMALTAFLFVLLFIKLPSGAPFFSPIERPSFAVAWGTAVRALKESPFLGFGPASFEVVYRVFYPPFLNETSFWNAEFPQSFSPFLTRSTDTGVIGLSAWLAFVVLLASASIKALARRSGPAALPMVGSFMSWLALVVAEIFMPLSLPLIILFWIFGGVLVAYLIQERQEVWMRSSALPAGVVIGVVSIAVGAVFTVRAFSAEVWYARALKAETIDAKIVYLDRAHARAPWNSGIARMRAEVFQAQFQNALAAGKDGSVLAPLAQGLLEAGQEAARLNPRDAQSLFSAAKAYMTVGSLAEGAPDEALTYLADALQLEPDNPVFYYTLGNAYLLKYEGLIRQGVHGDDARALSVLTRAEDAYREALMRRRSFAQAKVALGRVYQLKGNSEKALVYTEEGFHLDPLDLDAGLQFALLLIENNKKARAAAVLDSLLTIEPLFANALWYRGLLFEEEGNVARAREYFEIILRADPLSEKVIAKIAALLEGDQGSRP